MSMAQPGNYEPEEGKKETKFCFCCPVRFGRTESGENEDLIHHKNGEKSKNGSGYGTRNPATSQPRPSQEPRHGVESSGIRRPSPSQSPEIKMESLGLTKVDEIFGEFQSTFNAFYFCQVDMQSAVKDFKTAVNTTGEFCVCLSEFNQQLNGQRVSMKKLAIKFPTAVEKGGGSIADGAKALVSILKTYEEMENLPVKVVRKGVECLKDVMEIDISELAGEESGGGGINLASKIPKQLNSMRKNMKEIVKAPKIVSEFFKYATSIVKDVIDAFGDAKNMEYLTKKNDRVHKDLSAANQKTSAVAEPEPPKEINFTSLGIPTVDRVFNEVEELVNPVIRLTRDCFNARKSLEKAIKGISEFCDDPSKGFDDYVEEIKNRIKKGRVHIRISVNGRRIVIEKIEGLEPKQAQDMECGLKGVMKSGEELFDLAPNSIKEINALIQDVLKLSKSDIASHVSLKEIPSIPSKVSALRENAEKAKTIPGDLKFLLSFVRNLILDIKQVLNAEEEDAEESSEQEDGNSKA